MRKWADERSRVQLLSSPKRLFETGKCESGPETHRWGFRILARVVPKQQVAVSKLDNQDMRDGGAGEPGDRKGISGKWMSHGKSSNSVPNLYLIHHYLPQRWWASRGETMKPPRDIARGRKVTSGTLVQSDRTPSPTISKKAWLTRPLNKEIQTRCKLQHWLTQNKPEDNWGLRFSPSLHYLVLRWPPLWFQKTTSWSTLYLRCLTHGSLSKCSCGMNKWVHFMVFYRRRSPIRLTK